MKYKISCITPTLVGDGQQLSPIDYMVWKDQVNVLDQQRIFKLLSKGPRLEGYLGQLKKATTLDFASWGGFAQNYADRRIPFENAAYSAYWQRAPSESLNIPTFASGTNGPYLPGTAIKGALRTGMLSGDWRENTAPPEDQILGKAGSDRMRYVAAADSQPVGRDRFKVYLLRVSTLQSRAPGEYTLGWKRPGGTVDGRRPEDGTPIFAEMAGPGSVFEGDWRENHFFDDPEVRRALRWGNGVSRDAIFRAANDYAGKQLELQKQYAAWTALDLLAKQISELETKLAEARESRGCLLSIGWGGGFLSKAARLDTGRRSGFPFPKTRKIIFLENKPATLPGWVTLRIDN